MELISTTAAEALMEAKAKDTESARERLHRLVDQIPVGELHAAERFLEFVRSEPRGLPDWLRNAPLDDEPVTEEEEAGVREAWDDYRAGRVTTLDELEQELDR